MFYQLGNRINSTTRVENIDSIELDAIQLLWILYRVRNSPLNTRKVVTNVWTKIEYVSKLWRAQLLSTISRINLFLSHFFTYDCYGGSAENIIHHTNWEHSATCTFVGIWYTRCESHARIPVSRQAKTNGKLRLASSVGCFVTPLHTQKHMCLGIFIFSLTHFFFGHGPTFSVGFICLNWRMFCRPKTH